MSTNTWRRLIRDRTPLEVRQLYAHARRRYLDLARGVRFRTESGGGEWPVRRELVQVVNPGELYENKLSNLRRGAARIDQSLIRPGCHWSFWQRVGKPSAGNGFVAGRNIVDGALVPQVGGGLCQLSSLLYHLALLGGLEIVERHPHSIDIYRESERFTPLGADATVVWGYKDLRVKNPHPDAVSICCFVEAQRLVGRIHSAAAIASLEVQFVREEIRPGKVRVHTVVGDSANTVTDYEQRPGLRVR